jgi:capsular polysaccharide biosynthesis protein
MENKNITTRQNQNYRAEEEIDLLELLLEFKKRILVILAATLLGGVIAAAYSFLALTPQYTSTAMMYILSKETTLTSLADLQIGSQLTKDYKVIVTSRPVLEEVVDKLDLDITYKALKKKVTIDNPSDTRILSISATDSDPEMAKKIADQVANTSSEYIGDIMEMVPPKMIESGEIPTEKSSPSHSKNILLGMMVGLVLMCGLITLEVLLNDTIQTEDDVAKHLGLSVLASVPEREDEVKEDKEAMAKNKSAKNRKRGRQA